MGIMGLGARLGQGCGGTGAGWAVACVFAFHTSPPRTWHHASPQLTHPECSCLTFINPVGVMGGAAADLLSEAGYAVSAWTRTPHDLEGVTCYSGPGELQQVQRRGRSGCI